MSKRKLGHEYELATTIGQNHPHGSAATTLDLPGKTIVTIHAHG
jgi:hypothetical protein